MSANALIIRDGIVVTMNDDDDVIFGGDVAIKGNRIVAVGTAVDADEIGVDVTVIDAGGMVVMPGLVDLHYHTALAKGWSDHLPLWEYLDEVWYPMIRVLDPEAAYWAAASSYVESIRCGVTTVNDMYRQLDALARAAEDIGIRAVLSNDVADPEHNLDSLEDNHAAYQANHGKGDGRISVYIGIEWLPMASEELLRNARVLADELGTGIHIHLNESLSEIENSRERFGRRPTEVAYDTGILGRNCIAAHCVWLSDTEIALMKETNTQISHNPSSNAKLGNGIARVPEMVAAGLNVGLGHDAAECNNSRDIFQVMKFASLMHRASRVRSDIQDAGQVLRMATRNGSEALGHRGGVLAPGRTADLAILDTANPFFTPMMPGSKRHLYSHLVFAANGSCVDTTIVDGRVVYRAGEFTTIDETEVRNKANEAFQRVIARMEA